MDEAYSRSELLARLYAIEKDVDSLKSTIVEHREKIIVLNDSRTRVERLLERQDEKIEEIKIALSNIEKLASQNEFTRKVLVAVLASSVTTLGALMIKWYFTGLIQF
jgi:chromosome segregation ATPase